MNAIVIVFIATRDRQRLAEQMVAVRSLEVLPRGVDLNNTKADLNQTSNRDQIDPPLWTWFIENPRSCGA